MNANPIVNYKHPGDCEVPFDAHALSKLFVGQAVEAKCKC